jgi:hypothetical protein
MGVMECGIGNVECGMMIRYEIPLAEGDWVWSFSSGEWPRKDPKYPVNPV